MEQLKQIFSRPSNPQMGIGESGTAEFVATILIALFIGQAIAWIYQRTHSGLSYSMGFTQSLIILTLGAAILIVVIGGSLVTAFGLLGALAIVRFRNVLKDTRDTVFVFFALVLGMAVGTGRIEIALLGALTLILVVSWLAWTEFGAKGRFDGHVTLSVVGDGAALEATRADEVLDAFCRAVQRLTLMDHGHSTEVVCAIHLRDPDRASELAARLRSLPGIDEASVVLRDGMTEL